MNLNQAIQTVNAPATADFTSKEVFYKDVIISGTVKRVSENNVLVDLNLDEDLLDVLDSLNCPFDLSSDGTKDLTLDQVQRFVQNFAKFVQENDLTIFGYKKIGDESESEDESDDESSEDVYSSYDEDESSDD